MEHCIMIGCDLHDQNMLLKLALDKGTPERRNFRNTCLGRAGMVKELQRQSEAAGGARVVFAYEASSQGFGLYDELTEGGFECYVLAPTRIARSPRHRRSKCDEKDAERILELLRGYVLAGNDLPSIWVPDPQTRDDRELVRARLDLTEKRTAVKTQMQSLLTRHRIRKPSDVGESWSKKHRLWMRPLVQKKTELPLGARLALGTLWRQLVALEREVDRLDQGLVTLASTERYSRPVEALRTLKGVGLLTALVFLTEMGDLSRFSNRKQIGSFLGLVPSSNDSGEDSDRKGHITCQGPARVRKVLCQASWAYVRTDLGAHLTYEALVARNPKHKKIAVVAMMRRLAVRMWHIGLAAQREAGTFAAPASPAA